MSQDNKNMWIWNKVEKTNPDHTKKAKLKGREITTINATSQIKKATELFGSYGKGFGISSIQYDEKEFANDTILLIANSIFFYVDEDGKHEFPVSSSILYAYMTKPYKKEDVPYLVVDNEAYKKIETDITTKALSKLGFSADIFEGKYDDNQYVNSITAEFGEIKKQTALDLAIKEVQSAQTLKQLVSIHSKNNSLSKEPSFVKELTKRRKAIENDNSSK